MTIVDDQNKHTVPEPLYPTPTKGFLAPTSDNPQGNPPPGDSNEGGQPKAQHISLFGVIVYEVGAYLAGLFGILLVVAIMAAPISMGMISHADEYFGGLQDYFSIMYLGPIALVIFGIMALVRTDWIFLLYPVAVFMMVGPFIYDQTITQALALHLPFKIETVRSTNQYFTAVLISYAIVYTAEHTLSKLSRRGRFKINGRTPSEIITLVSIAVVFMVILGGLFLASPNIVSTYRRSLILVRMPQTKEFNAVAQYATQDSFMIEYPSLDNKDQDRYTTRDSVTFTNIEQGQSRKTEDVCGDRFISNHTNEAYTVQYTTTPNGLRYGSYQLHPAKSKAADGSMETYTTNYHCFVIDKKKYIIERSEFSDTSRLEAVPTSELIASFKDARAYALCFEASPNCTNADIEALPIAKKLYQN